MHAAVVSTNDAQQETSYACPWGDKWVHADPDGACSWVQVFVAGRGDSSRDRHRHVATTAIVVTGESAAGGRLSDALGAIVEYTEPLWTVRFGELLMPTVANGIDHDFDRALAHALAPARRQARIHGHLERHLGASSHVPRGRRQSAREARGVVQVI